jgi:hypothetical protein
MKMLDGFIGCVLSNEVESRHHIFGMFRRSRQEQSSAHVCALIICVGNFNAGFRNNAGDWKVYRSSAGKVDRVRLKGCAVFQTEESVMRLYPRLAASAAFVAILVISRPGIGTAAGMGGGMMSSGAMGDSGMTSGGSMGGYAGSMNGSGSAGGYGYADSAALKDQPAVRNLSRTGLRNYVTVSPARQSLPTLDSGAGGALVPVPEMPPTPASGAAGN